MVGRLEAIRPADAIAQAGMWGSRYLLAGLGREVGWFQDLVHGFPMIVDATEMQTRNGAR